MALSWTYITKIVKEKIKTQNTIFFRHGIMSEIISFPFEENNRRIFSFKRKRRLTINVDFLLKGNGN